MRLKPPRRIYNQHGFIDSGLLFIPDEIHKSKIHVLLHMTVQQGEAGIVCDKIHCNDLVRLALSQLARAPVLSACMLCPPSPSSSNVVRPQLRELDGLQCTIGWARADSNRRYNRLFLGRFR